MGCAKVWHLFGGRSEGRIICPLMWFSHFHPKASLAPTCPVLANPEVGSATTAGAQSQAERRPWFWLVVYLLISYQSHAADVLNVKSMNANDL